MATAPSLPSPATMAGENPATTIKSSGSLPPFPVAQQTNQLRRPPKTTTKPPTSRHCRPSLSHCRLGFNHQMASDDGGKSSDIQSKLPKPKDFSRALYMMDSGQNDIHYGLEYMIEEEVKKSIPNIISQFTVAVVQLYEKGARAFWIHNTGPIGCLPYFLVEYPPSPDNADQNGCVKSYNEVAQEFNKQLKDSVSRLRDQHPDAVLICVDLYSAKYSLISNAKDYGFVDPLRCCCGRMLIVVRRQW
ncbi:hypothetical protein P3L10_030459 [Capsicum annuum]